MRTSSESGTGQKRLLRNIPFAHESPDYSIFALRSDFSITAVRSEISGLIGNSIPAPQLLTAFGKGFCHLLWIVGKQYSPAGLLCQLAEIRITLIGGQISLNQGR
jgi:hypothetical protein